MSKYTWNSMEIIKRIETLNKKTRTPDEEHDLIILNEMLGINLLKQQIVPNLETEPKIECIQQLNELAKEFYKQSWTKTIALPPNYSLIKPDRVYLDIISNFFQKHNKHFYEFFQTIFEKNSTNLRIRNAQFNGRELPSTLSIYHLLTTNESFIDIEKNYTIYDLLNLVRGYSDAIAFQINKNYSTNPNFYLIRKLASSYFEYKFIQYLIENDIYAAEAVLAEVITDQRMARNAQQLPYYFIPENASNLTTYLATIELGTLDDNTKSDEILTQIIKSNPQSISENFHSLEEHGIILTRNVPEQQKRLELKMNTYFKKG